LFLYIVGELTKKKYILLQGVIESGKKQTQRVCVLMTSVPWDSNKCLNRIIEENLHFFNADNPF